MRVNTQCLKRWKKHPSEHYYYRLTSVSRLSHDCLTPVSRLSHVCLTPVSRFSRLSQVCVTPVSSLSHARLMAFSRLSQACLTSVSRLSHITFVSTVRWHFYQTASVYGYVISAFICSIWLLLEIQIDSQSLWFTPTYTVELESVVDSTLFLGLM